MKETQFICRCTAVVVLLLVVCASACYPAADAIPKTGAKISSFVPRGWDILGQASGDLNRDGIPDAAFVLKNKAEDKEGGDSGDTARLLVIVFGVSAGGYVLSVADPDPILCKTCGGVYGDPFAGIRIERGTLVIEHYGGSSDRWGYTRRLRFQDGDWLIIGTTDVTENSLTGAYQKTDTNLLTGERVVQIKPAKGKAATMRSRVPVKPLPKLSDGFTFSER